MMCGEAEAPGGLTPVRNGDEAAGRFVRRTSPIFKFTDCK